MHDDVRSIARLKSYLHVEAEEMQTGMKNGMTRLIFAVLGIFLLSLAAVAVASTVQYRYDELDRLYSAEYDDGTIVEYVYDNVGNRIEQRGVDITPPVTTAIPSGRQYTTSFTVSLSCSDEPGGSGCDKIYYTVDNTTPTISSPVYSSPLVIGNVDTVLKYFAMDRAGNTETVKTQNYIIETRTITASAGTGGSISPSGTVAVNYGSSPAFTIIPNTGYAISNVVVDNTSQGAISTYTFNNVTTNHTINATFAFNAVMVMSPNGGEVIPSGGSFTIQWGAPPAAVKFNLFYTLDGSSYTTIANKVTGTAYNWTVPKPSANSALCKVKVVGLDSSNQTVGTDFSDANFTIEVVRLTSPNGGGGQTLQIGGSVPITWTTNGTSKSVNKVKLSYSTNGGASWTAIATVTGNPGTYNWTVPNSPGSMCKARVELFNNNTAVGDDASDQNFTIAP
jgi:YD repeat-containing protein